MIDEKKLDKYFHALRSYALQLESNGSKCSAKLMFEIADYLKSLKEQPQADKWIPCEERLPKIGQCVLIQLDMNEYDSEYDSTIQVRRYDGEQDVYKWKWEGLDIWTSEDAVLAWQPLPQPYKKEGAE